MKPAQYFFLTQNRIMKREQYIQILDQNNSVPKTCAGTLVNFPTCIKMVHR